MSEISSLCIVDAGTRSRVTRKPLRLALVLMTLSGASAAVASAAVTSAAASGGAAVGAAPGEQLSFAGESKLSPNFNAAPLRLPMAQPTRLPPAPSMFALSATYQAEPGLDPHASRDFRPRGLSVFDRDSQSGTAGDIPMLHQTTVWQRLADYRSHGRIQVLTLWENGASSFSLQAGKKGEPSLQWTSRLMNHGGATRGVLDQWVSTSITHVNRTPHEPPHGFNNEPASKPGKSLEMGLGGNQ